MINMLTMVPQGPVAPLLGGLDLLDRFVAVFGGEAGGARVPEPISPQRGRAQSVPAYARRAGSSPVDRRPKPIVHPVRPLDPASVVQFNEEQAQCFPRVRTQLMNPAFADRFRQATAPSGLANISGRERFEGVRLPILSRPLCRLSIRRAGRCVILH